MPKKTTKAVEQKRQTYSLDPARSRELRDFATALSDETGRRVHRQDVLDFLVTLLADKAIAAKVKKAMQ